MRHGDADGLGGLGDVLGQRGQVVVDQAEQLAVDQQQVHRRVAGAFADAECGRVDAIGAGFDSRQAVGDRQLAVAVAVPVDLDVGVVRLGQLAHELQHRLRPLRSGVAHRVTHRTPCTSPH